MPVAPDATDDGCAAAGLLQLEESPGLGQDDEPGAWKNSAGLEVVSAAAEDEGVVVASQVLGGSVVVGAAVVDEQTPGS